MGSSETYNACWKVRSKSAEETFRLGKALGELIARGTVISLRGDLGSGKTVLAKGIARGMQVADEGEVTSPSFTLVNEYQGRWKIYHVDLYRLQNAQQIEDLGWEEMIFGPAVALIEWPEKILHLLPEDRLEVLLQWVGEEERDLEFQSKGGAGKDLIERLREKWTKGE